MKTIFISSLLGMLISTTGCEQTKLLEDAPETEHTVEKMIYDVIKGKVETIIIDDCEYLIFKKEIGNNQGYGFMSHKGNCNNPLHNYRTPDGEIIQ